MPSIYNSIEEALAVDVQLLDCLQYHQEGSLDINVFEKAEWWNDGTGAQFTSFICNDNSGLFSAQLYSQPDLMVNYSIYNRVYNIYEDFGLINGVRFYRVRWEGFTDYDSTADEYSQKFDAFFFDNENGRDILYLKFTQVPQRGLYNRNSFRGHSFTPVRGAANDFYWTYNGTSYGNTEQGVPELVNPSPHFLYDFLAGQKYRAVIRSFMSGGGSTKSNYFEFENTDTPQPDSYARAQSLNEMEIHRGSLIPRNRTPSYRNHFKANNIIEQGKSLGLSYVFYGSNSDVDGEYRLCVITGRQQYSSSGDSPWNGRDTKCKNLVIYVDAHLINMSSLFTCYPETTCEVIFGDHVTFASPIDCSGAFEVQDYSSANNVNLSYVYDVNYDSLSIMPSNTYEMFRGSNVGVSYTFYGANWKFICSLDYTFCRNMSYMFQDCRNMFDLEPADFECLWSLHTDGIDRMFYNTNVYNNISFSSKSSKAVHSLYLLFGGESNHAPNFTSFTFHNTGLTSIAHAFENCSALTSVDISATSDPSSGLVYRIDLYQASSAFKNCSSLSTLNLNGLRFDAGTYASQYDGLTFYGCTNLQSLQCPLAIEDYVQIPLPYTMYDSQGTAYTYLPGRNITIYSTNPTL